MLNTTMEQIKEATEYLKNHLSQVPSVALVLGSGLGYFADLLEEKEIVDYKDIPHFPVSTAPDHQGRFVLGQISGKAVLVMQGRIHYYEGYSMDEVVFPVRVMKKLGIQHIFLTNAAGGINEEYRVGDIMMISDHIKFFNDTPLRGKNIDEFGPRFNDMSDAYTRSLRSLARKIAEENGISLREGVYSYMPGPCFETPAEIRMLRILGADVVGMSTVPEVICASHAGLNVFALSFVTNLAAGMLDKMHELEYTPDGKDNFNRLITEMIKALA